MIDMNETTTAVSKTRYTTQAPDGTQIVADLTETLASITYGGTSLVVPVDAMPAVVAIAATVNAAIVPIQSTPVEEEPPVEEPAPEDPPA